MLEVYIPLVPNMFCCLVVDRINIMILQKYKGTKEKILSQVNVIIIQYSSNTRNHPADILREVREQHQKDHLHLPRL